MKKIIALATVLFLIVFYVGCGKTETPEREGEMKVSAMSFKAGYTPEKAIDGDISTGWICKKKASETNMQIFNVDLGKQTEFGKIIIDDSFSAGYTNKRPAYLNKTVNYLTGNTSSIKAGASVSNAVSGAADGLSWETENVPTEEAPEWLWISLEESVAVKKIELNNDINNSVPVSFELYVSGTEHNDKNCTDVSGYTLVKREEANEDKIINVEFEETIEVKDTLLIVRKQQNEGQDVAASLDEIIFSGEVPEDYAEDHYPVKFSILGSVKGDEYEEICFEKSNYLSVWEKELDKPVKYRYIRYVVFEEYNNNAPSIGEIRFE